MKKVLILILFFLVANKVYATAQFGDLLVYKGETVSIFSNPLESYFDKKNPRPDNLFQFTCTACWRGYIATWKIDDNYLYLMKLVEGTCSSNAEEIQISKVFPGSNGPVKATWFTGTIRIPQGKELEYIHMGYRSKYEKDLFITFENGKLIKEILVDNTKK
ncbi:MAG: hypothetical protein GY699_12315 [Desulfobacteraceae bacterium]|nr:hypothetical protein [Desulfobacteraceae bacterium]